jgi:hypothetical protein
MAAFNKFQAFVEEVFEAKIDFQTHSFKVMLTNSAPVATNTIKADLTDISAGNGYSAGGTATTITSSAQTSGTYKAVASDVVFTASGGSIGPFRYAVLYDDTQTSPAKPLCAWWDYGSAITLLNGEVFTVDFDATNGILQAT